MSLRRRFPNPVLSELHPGVLPGGIRQVLLVGEWSSDAADLLAVVRRAFPGAGLRLLSGASEGPLRELLETWKGALDDPAVIRRVRAARVDLLVPIEPYGLMGDVRPELERFALTTGARAVAVHEATYGMVRIATRSHLRYRLYLRPWACRVFGMATLACVMAPLYLAYVLAQAVGLWSPLVGREDWK